MTKLLVHPIDPDAPGSFKKRRRVLEAVRDAQVDIADGNNIAAYLLVEDIVLDQLETDDGTPVQDVLDSLSSNEFDAVFRGLLQSSVPQMNAAT